MNHRAVERREEVSLIAIIRVSEENQFRLGLEEEVAVVMKYVVSEVEHRLTSD